MNTEGCAHFVDTQGGPGDGAARFFISTFLHLRHHSDGRHGAFGFRDLEVEDGGELEPETGAARPAGPPSRRGTRDGERVWVEISRTALSAGDPFKGSYWAFDGVTARRTAEQKLRNALRLNEEAMAELQAALQKVKTLSGLLPIRMHCHNIRDDRGYWGRLEKYISEPTEASFSHGLRPECLVMHYPED